MVEFDPNTRSFVNKLDSEALLKKRRYTRQQHDLLMILIKREITLKYKRTYLGILWSLLNPVLTAIVLFVAFRIILRFNMENYTFFLLTALFPWNWFASSVLMSTNVLTGNVNLIKKVLFPRHFLIISIIIGELVNLLFAIPILICFGYYYGQAPGFEWFIGIPLLIIIQFIIILGISLALSMMNAFFADMQYLIGVAINMLFWLTPIIYPFTAIPDDLRAYFTINPLMYLISAWRDILLYSTIKWSHIGISSITALSCLLIGMKIFTSLGKRLDEVL